MSQSAYMAAVAELDRCIAGHQFALEQIQAARGAADAAAESDFDKRSRRAEAKVRGAGEVRERITQLLQAPHLPGNIAAALHRPAAKSDPGQRSTAGDAASLEADIARLVEEIDSHQQAARERRRAEAAARAEFHETQKTRMPQVPTRPSSRWQSILAAAGVCVLGGGVAFATTGSAVWLVVGLIVAISIVLVLAGPSLLKDPSNKPPQR